MSALRASQCVATQVADRLTLEMASFLRPPPWLTMPASLSFGAKNRRRLRLPLEEYTALDDEQMDFVARLKLELVGLRALCGRSVRGVLAEDKPQALRDASDPRVRRFFRREAEAATRPSTSGEPSPKRTVETHA